MNRYCLLTLESGEQAFLTIVVVKQQDGIRLTLSTCSIFLYQYLWIFKSVEKINKETSLTCGTGKSGKK